MILRFCNNKCKPFSFGQPQTSADSSSEVPPMPHMHASAGQPWATTGGQGASAAVASQHTTQQPATVSSADSVSLLFLFISL